MGSFLDFFTSPIAIDILVKMLLALILSGIIGVERELIHKPAGVKTHTLICMSATLTMATALYMQQQMFPNMDPSRLPAQILAGIGFVGAGTIIREGFAVKGITTAASLLGITCIGLAVGAGFYEGAILATVFFFLMLSLTSPLQTLIHKNRKHVLFNLEAKTSDGIIGKAEEIFNKNDVEILNIQKIENYNTKSYTFKFVAICKNPSLKETILNDLCKIENVNEVYTSKRFYRQDVE